MSQTSTLMTEGNIQEKMIKFAVPIFLGDLFQQLYNVVDALVVGNVLGENALAAVSSTGSLIFLMVGFFGGMFTGVGVIISKFFGAQDYDNTRKAVGTAVAFGLLSGIVLTIVGVLFTPTILRWMGTPENVFADSQAYIRIYFAGILSNIMYNTATGIFRAIGDSKHPLYYLIVSALTNVVLDILFVAGIGMGVEGAAYATIIAQTLSATLAFYKLCHVDAVYKVEINNIRMDREILGKMLRVGIPSGIQNSVIAIANVVVQASVNSFGSAAMAGNGSYSKIEGFAFIPITSFSMSLTTFISQNLGAGEYERAKKGARFGIVSAVILAELTGIAIFLFGENLIALFADEADVIAYGVARIRANTLFYFLLAFSHSVAGVMRGAGKSTIPMFVMLGCWCVIRVSYITIIMKFVNNITAVFLAYPLTWSLSSILFLLFYLKSDWVHGLDRK